MDDSMPMTPGSRKNSAMRVGVTLAPRVALLSLCT